ncbi:hypothetical protein PMAYCL1PPCAC_26539, partial [Pristionchus mayeri]
QEMTAFKLTSIAFLLAIAHFFYQSNGFTRYFNYMYRFWVCTPLLVLITFVALHGGGLTRKDRSLLFIALSAGCIGDHVMGIAEEGVVPGAIAFGIGHIAYMLTFAPKTLEISRNFALALLSFTVVTVCVCILPLAKISIIAVILMSVYAFILAASVIYAASQCWHGNSEHPAFSPGLNNRLLGFALFYLSDAVIIEDATLIKVPLANPIIFLTYFSAQYLILRAAIVCEQLKAKRKSS